MMYKDVLTMLVRDMQTDVVPMREVKLKYFAFEEISCLWWGILLFSVSLLFFLLLLTQFYWWVTEMVYRNVLIVLVRVM